MIQSLITFTRGKVAVSKNTHFMPHQNSFREGEANSEKQRGTEREGDQLHKKNNFISEFSIFSGNFIEKLRMRNL